MLTACRHSLIRLCFIVLYSTLAIVIPRLAVAGDVRASDSSAIQLRTVDGVEYGIWNRTTDKPAPVLFVLASTIDTTLGETYYRQSGNELAEHGWVSVSIDLPCHSKQTREGEPSGLGGWSHRLAEGEDIVAEFNARLSKVLDHLIKTGVADPERIAVCGTSRGGFLAIHFAAHDDRVKCVAAFAPMTDPRVVDEFVDNAKLPLVVKANLENQAMKLAGRPVWIVIGDQDQRVGTDRAQALAQKLKAASLQEKLDNRVELHVMPEPRGHATPMGSSKRAAAWIYRQVTGRDIPVANTPAAPVKSSPEIITTHSYTDPVSTVVTPYLLYQPAPESRAEQRSLLIFLYGAGGSLSNYNVKRPPYAKLREHLARRGYYIVVPALGKYHFMNDAAKTALDGVVTEVLDQQTIPADRVHVMGTSMGGGSSLAYAIHRQDMIRSVCAVMPMTDFAVWVVENPGYATPVAEAFGGTQQAVPGRYTRNSAVRNIDAFADIPVMLVHGTQDTTVSYQQSRKLADLLHDRKYRCELCTVTGMAHKDDVMQNVQIEAADFFDAATE